MIPFRRVAAVFALIALAFSFAETASASACEHAAAAQAEHSSHHDSSVPAPQDCPLGLANSCAVSVSLPAAQTFVVESTPEHALAVTPDGDVVNLITITAIFHPPRV